MKALAWSAVVVCVSLGTALTAAAQTPVGALAIDERQGDQYGWAVDYETAATARAAALRECGAECSVVLTFTRCGAYAADQDSNSTAVGWAESYDSAPGARQAALAECGSRGGSGCTVRVWGCNGPVVEEALGLDRAARRLIQEELRSAGFDPGGADGLFGPRTRRAIRNWQSSRGARATGYLDGAAVEALQPAGGQPAATTAAVAVSPEPLAVPAAQQPASRAQPSPAPSSTAELEGLFWQSIMSSTNPADFEAYLEQFPNGVFRTLAQNRLAAFREPEGTRPTPTASGFDGAGPPAAGSSLSGSSGAAGSDVRRRPGEAFRDCDVCPEMVVLPDGDLALGRYEVTRGEYRAFASATGGGADDCTRGDSWRNLVFPQTDLHPVTCVSWDDAQEYVLWLSRTTGASYRLPTEAEWERAAVGSQPGCYRDRTGSGGTCSVGSYDSNAAGLSDMLGNVQEWVQDCYTDACEYRATRGGPFFESAAYLRQVVRGGGRADYRRDYYGFRVARTLP